jgi:hypothetical protein
VLKNAMPKTVEAVVDEHGQIRLLEPLELRASQRVLVTVLEEETEREGRGQRMADALTKLAESGTFSGVEDPVAWQREVRDDRPLPGRDR